MTKKKIKEDQAKEKYLGIIERFLEINEKVDSILYYYFNNPKSINGLRNFVKSLILYESELEKMEYSLSSYNNDPLNSKTRVKTLYMMVNEMIKELYPEGENE